MSPEPSQTNDAFHEPRFSPNAGWIVVDINFNARRTEDRIQRSDKSVDDPKTRTIATMFDQPVVVCCENVQTFTRCSAARKTQQE